MNTSKTAFSRVQQAFGTVGMAALAVAAASSGAMAQTVQNGNFTSWVTGPSTTGTTTWSQLGVTNAGVTPTLQNWSLTGNPNGGGIVSVMISGNPTSYATAGVNATPFAGTAYSNGSAPNLPTPAPSYGILWTTPGVAPVTGYGGNILVADGDSQYNQGIVQTLSGLTMNKNYTLTFYQSAGQQVGWTGALNDTWQVTFGNGTPQTATTMVVPNEGSVAWTKQTLSFTASGASETLQFLATSNDSGSNEPPLLLLADVSLSQQVPEPASLAILGLGLAGLAGLRRRRRRRQTA